MNNSFVYCEHRTGETFRHPRGAPVFTACSWKTIPPMLTHRGRSLRNSFTGEELVDVQIQRPLTQQLGLTGVEEADDPERLAVASSPPPPPTPIPNISCQLQIQSAGLHRNPSSLSPSLAQIASPVQGEVCSRRQYHNSSCTSSTQV